MVLWGGSIPPYFSKILNMITITPKGYGHWKVEITYYRKKIGTTVSDSQLIDDIRDGGKSAIKKARQIIIEQNKTWKSC